MGRHPFRAVTKADVPETFSRALARCRHRLVPPCLRRAPPLQKRYWADLGHHFGSARHHPRHRRALPHPLPDLRRQRQRAHALWQLRGLTCIASVYVKQISAHSTCACVHLSLLNHRSSPPFERWSCHSPPPRPASSPTMTCTSCQHRATSAPMADTAPTVFATLSALGRVPSG